ncbi:shikimate kinase [Desulfonatronum thioautotrophicum]|uniref:shikimate kinase n=1 Tax=Desulfonatronum thioautotrophicum TaxID=617001 RepID=UPI00069A0E9C|nr:shikimate kinase [Desulfonatronum thioautotrophicum]
MSRFIRKTVGVANSDAVRIHQHGQHEAETFAGRETNIFLVGLRASGKSTLGRLLAQRLEMRFVDTDELVVERAGQSIDALVLANGWEDFRRLESEALRDVCAQSGQVVATGGGIVLDSENQHLIQRSGITFYLMAEIPTLLSRLTAAAETPHRPALSTLPPREELIQSNAQRGPIYMNLANHILRTEDSLESTLQDALIKLGIQ